MKQAWIIDDSRVARITLRKILLAEGLEVVEHDSAIQAFDQLSESTELPAIIFMDAVMPGMDGLTAIRQLKSDDKLSHIPVAMFTGNESTLDRQQAEQAGALAVINKPPQQEIIQDLITSLPEPEAEPETVTKPERTKQSVVVKVDKASMTNKVVEIIENKLQAKLEQQIQEISTEVATQVSQNYVEAQLPSVVATQLDSSVENQPEFNFDENKQQLIETVESELQTTIRIQVEQAVKNALTQANISQKVTETISAQTPVWLVEQQQNVDKQVEMQLKQASSDIEQQLQTSLTELVQPLVAVQVQQQLVEQFDTTNTGPTRVELKVKGVSERLSQLHNLVLAMAAILFVVAIISLF